MQCKQILILNAISHNIGLANFNYWVHIYAYLIVMVHYHNAHLPLASILQNLNRTYEYEYEYEYTQQKTIYNINYPSMQH